MSSLLVASSSGSGASVTLIVSVLGALGIGAIVAAFVTGLFSKKKLGAEAASLITNAASTVTKMMEDRLAESKLEVEKSKEAMQRMAEAHHSELARMAEAHALQNAEWRRVLQLHVAWDAIAIAEIAKLQVELPPPPPVTPAQRFVDESGFPLSIA